MLIRRIMFFMMLPNYLIAMIQDQNSTNLCPFSRIPKDVTSLIAEGLVSFESDPAFLQRTVSIDQGSDKNPINFNNRQLRVRKLFLIFWFSYKLNGLDAGFKKLPLIVNNQTPQEILFSLSPDFSKIIFLEKLNSLPNHMYVDDLKTNNKLIIPKEQLKLDEQVKAIAISSDANHVAGLTIRQEVNNICSISLNVLNLRNRLFQHFHFVRNSEPKSCHFNKQGTKIVVNFDNERVVRFVSSEKTHHMKTHWPLLKYFQDHGVCKDWNPKKIQ